MDPGVALARRIHTARCIPSGTWYLTTLRRDLRSRLVHPAWPDTRRGAGRAAPSDAGHRQADGTEHRADRCHRGRLADDRGRCHRPGPVAGWPTEAVLDGP